MKVAYHPQVRKEILLLPDKDRGRITNIVYFFSVNGLTLSTEYLKKIRPNLWELRSKRWRLLFGFVEEVAVITNIFYKNTKKTPKREIKLAIARLNQYI